MRRHRPKICTYKSKFAPTNQNLNGVSTSSGSNQIRAWKNKKNNNKNKKKKQEENNTGQPQGHAL